jgi:hypothetical protein
MRYYLSWFSIRKFQINSLNVTFLTPVWFDKFFGEFYKPNLFSMYNQNLGTDTRGRCVPLDFIKVDFVLVHIVILFKGQRLLFLVKSDFKETGAACRCGRQAPGRWQ